jgi:hypothetical protein
MPYEQRGRYCELAYKQPNARNPEDLGRVVFIQSNTDELPVVLLQRLRLIRVFSPSSGGGDSHHREDAEQFRDRIVGHRPVLPVLPYDVMDRGDGMARTRSQATSSVTSRDAEAGYGPVASLRLCVFAFLPSVAVPAGIWRERTNAKTQ